MLHVQNVHLGSWGTGGYLISLLTIGLFRWTKIIVHVQNVHLGIGGDLISSLTKSLFEHAKFKC